MRHVPSLEFIHDALPETARHLDDVLAKARASDAAVTASAAGAVYAGEAEKPECTLELSDADFMAMTSGKADPQKLFGEGKLKIGGNLMASTKLGFLKKIDMSKVKPGSAAKPAAAASAPAAAPKSAQAPAILERAAGRFAEAKTAGTINGT